MLSRSRCLALLLFGSLASACQDAPRHSSDPATAADADTPDPDAEPDEPEADADEPDPDVDAGSDGVDADAVDADSIDAEVVDGGADAGGPDASTRPGVIPGVGFGDALRVDPEGPLLLVNVRAAKQLGYFVFHAEADTFYELTTDSGFYSPDNVIELYDAQRHVIATNDDGSIWPGDGIDSRLLVHVAQAGDYYLRVQDPFTPAEFFEDDALYFYYLKIQRITDQTPGFARVRADGCGTPSFRHDDRSGYDYVTLLGMFGEQESLCSFTGLADRALIAHVAAGGVEHDGSSFTGGRVRVASVERGVVAEIDRALGQENIHPPLGAGPHAVGVFAAGTAALGDNPYYSVDLIQLPENPAERTESENNVLAGSEAVNLTGTRARRGLVLARLPAGDVDYYRFELAQGDLVRVACEAESAGSGVRGLGAEIRDANDQKLSSGGETSLENLVTEAVAAPTAGTYHLRLFSAAATPSGIEPWVRCALLINR